MGRRIALLSNVNMNYAIRLLKQEFEIYETEGYGNELGWMLNESSSYHEFDPEATFLIVDLMELLEHDLTVEGSRMDQWFALLEGALKPDRLYWISDAYLWGPPLEVVTDSGRKQALETLWQERLDRLCARHPNVRIFPFRHMLEKLGEDNAFSLKMWYLGGILLTNAAQKTLCGLVSRALGQQARTPRKVLVLDLDNTLWGGLAGETDHTPVILSEDHVGLAYKNLQRVIRQMQSQGVLLAIVSKNNEQDAMELLSNHPHMVLRPECFAARRINWEPKHENIVQIARELNLGTDSFVFWDDSSAERELVKQLLPEVAVPDFPERPEELSEAMTKVYRDYFEKDVLTREDLDKTGQYAANARRRELEAASYDFDAYLKELDIVITRVTLWENTDRLVQLVNKTNQFNLTTKRYDLAQMQAVLEDPLRRVYLYRVSDRFGDSGIVAAAVVALPGGAARMPRTDGAGVEERMRQTAGAGERTQQPAGVSEQMPRTDGARNQTQQPAGVEERMSRTPGELCAGIGEAPSGLPLLEELVMSCRVMGRDIELALVEDIEDNLMREGFEGLCAQYRKTSRNAPVEQLFERLGYEVTDRFEDGSKDYRLLFGQRPARKYFVRKE